MGAGYRYEATSAEGFLQQLAVCYLKNRYQFYVRGCLREGKDLGEFDRRIIEKYGIAKSKHARYRSKGRGEANVQYLRYGREYILLATVGFHRFYEVERPAIRDAGRVPIRFGDYAIAYQNGHPRVRISEERFKDLKAYFRGVATVRAAKVLWAEFRTLPYEPDAPVRGQLFRLLGEVNRLRKAAGMKLVDGSAIRIKRQIVRPFERKESKETVEVSGE